MARRYAMRVRVLMHPIALFTAAVVTVACSDTRHTVRADCTMAATDSARAVCVALDTVARGWGLTSRVRGIARDGGVTRVYTVPADPNTLDGIGVVDVGPDGRVLRATITDSA